MYVTSGDVYPEIRRSGIGDINGTGAGTAARYNTGKPPLGLVPLTLIAMAMREEFKPGCLTIGHEVMMRLGAYQHLPKDGREVLKGIYKVLSYPWEDCANVFDYGRKKYKEWNWLRGMPWSEVLNSAARHALALYRGETVDPESNLPHVGHIMCNVVMLDAYIELYPEGNDLPGQQLLPGHLRSE